MCGRYNPEWENLSNFKDWLEPCNRTVKKAYCKYCRVTFTACLGFVVDHQRGSKHALSELLHLRRQQESINRDVTAMQRLREGNIVSILQQVI